MNVVPACYRQCAGPENIHTSPLKKDLNFMGTGEGSIGPKHLKNVQSLIGSPQGMGWWGGGVAS